MKRLIALLAALTMVFACGCSNTTDETNQNGTDNNMTEDQNHDGVVDDGNTVGDDIQNGMDNVGDAVENGMDNAGNAIDNGMDKAGDAVTGNDKGTTTGTADTGAQTNPKTVNP